MQPHLQRVEVEAMWRRDHDLAVDDTASRQSRQQRRMEIRKVSIQRPQIAALDVEFAVVAKDDRAEAVPLGLIEEAGAAGHSVHELGEHRLDWRLNQEAHKSTLP